MRTGYRLFLHPLRIFPDSQLVIISHLYKYFYDVIKGGMYVEKTNRMHEAYGWNPESYMLDCILIPLRLHHTDQPMRAPC